MLSSSSTPTAHSSSRIAVGLGESINSNIEGGGRKRRRRKATRKRKGRERI